MPKKPRKPLKPQGRCIFCGGTGLSKEHVWSEWLQQLIPRKDTHGEYWASMRRDGGKEIEHIEPASSNTRQGSVLQQRVRNVCERKCNNGWMSRVVDRSKPYLEGMILGQSFQLSGENQTDIAAWIGITTIVQEFKNRGRARRIPPKDRTVLMNTEAPPSSWTIWIASYVGEWWSPMGHYHIPMTYSKRLTDTSPDSPSGELQLTTFTLGALLVHVFTATQDDMIERYRTYIRSAANSVKLKQLWPIVDYTMEWPPPRPFRDEEVDRLAFDWVENEWGVSGLPGQAETRRILGAAEALAKLIADSRKH